MGVILLPSVTRNLIIANIFFQFSFLMKGTELQLNIYLRISLPSTL